MRAKLHKLYNNLKTKIICSQKKSRKNQSSILKRFKIPWSWRLRKFCCKEKILFSFIIGWWGHSGSTGGVLLWYFNIPILIFCNKIIFYKIFSFSNIFRNIFRKKKRRLGNTQFIAKIENNRAKIHEKLVFLKNILCSFLGDKKLDLQMMNLAIVKKWAQTKFELENPTRLLIIWYWVNLYETLCKDVNKDSKDQ